ncbi:hypothetical protein NJ959_16365 [Symplocastrum sp. BBK-W-15]|uniref:Uncharacterized protein n=1 Tax=Limnofasciculus baicalensis BBK-W-15 TaxID=2699891 RepID=A0AAE3GUH7_9CYAN|nr:hypothetical protein [Limnofasciculus baicalensis BBK-W-15]
MKRTKFGNFSPFYSLCGRRRQRIYSLSVVVITGEITGVKIVLKSVSYHQDPI